MPVFPPFYVPHRTQEILKRSYLSQGVVFWSKICYRGRKRQSEYSRREYVALPVVSCRIANARHIVIYMYEQRPRHYDSMFDGAIDSSVPEERSPTPCSCRRLRCRCGHAYPWSRTQYNYAEPDVRSHEHPVAIHILEGEYGFKMCQLRRSRRERTSHLETAAQYWAQ